MSAWRWLAAGALFAALLGAQGCGDGEKLDNVPGTAVRVGQPQNVEGTELQIDIQTTRAKCENLVMKPSDIPVCMPYVDRASGEVRISLQFKDGSENYEMPLTQEKLRVIHQGTEVLDGQFGQRYLLVPHDPKATPQLFILVIDGSSSMNEGGRMGKVREALLLPAVKKAFFPGTDPLTGQPVRTGVIILTFTDSKPQPLGGTLKVIEDVGEYTKLVRTELRVLNGYTHLFNSIQYATGELLDDKEVKRFIEFAEAQPTVIALTDGFNNMANADTCGTNAGRLTTLLKHLKSVREDDVDLRKRPTIYTVGLGRALMKNFEVPDGSPTDVLPNKLCGKYANQRIDGDLERYGIDNASMSWIADVGGGFAYVKKSKDGLGEAFAAAAARRYRWFEVRYRVDPFYLRRSFVTGLRLLSFAKAEAKVKIYPSAWLDAPPGVPIEDNWHTARTFRHTATVAVPVLGLGVALIYLSAAIFNTRRALFRRGSRPSAPPGRGGAPPPPPGG